MEDVKPTTPSAGAGAVPKELEKFKGSDGKLDAEKMAQSYLEAQKMAHEATEGRAAAERAYAALTEQIERSGVRPDAGPGRGADAGDDGGSDEPLTRADARPVVTAFIELIHPEVAVDPATGKPKDEKFFDGLKRYVATLPLPVKQAIVAGDFSAQDWAIKQYKAVMGGAGKAGPAAGSQPSGEKPNFIEGATPGGGDGKKTWTVAEIRQLAAQNPKEYARLADTEIAEAYKEGRVK